MATAFFDTNVVVYLLSGDTAKADVSERLIAAGGVVSVQVLNEFASVARRKLALDLDEVAAVTAAVRAHCEVVPVTEAIHDLGVALIRRYALSVYDAMIVAAAVDAGVAILYSEDMHDGLVVDSELTIRNPYC